MGKEGFVGKQRITTAKFNSYIHLTVQNQYVYADCNPESLNKYHLTVRAVYFVMLDNLTNTVTSPYCCFRIKSHITMRFKHMYWDENMLTKC